MALTDVKPDLDMTVQALRQMPLDEIKFITFCLDRLHKGLSGDQVWLEYLDSNSGSV